jgi:hypothetical protein
MGDRRKASGRADHALAKLGHEVPVIGCQAAVIVSRVRAETPLTEFVAAHHAAGDARYQHGRYSAVHAGRLVRSHVEPASRDDRPGDAHGYVGGTGQVAQEPLKRAPDGQRSGTTTSNTSKHNARARALANLDRNDR